MSIPLLIECSNEIRRLSIAGSSLAIGDFRLKRFIEPLAKAGEKAAVFAKIATAVESLINSTEKNSAENLLTLATLIHAVLYTQGETSVKGEFTDLIPDDMGILTPPTPTRILKPLIEAMTTTGSGRFEIIKDANEKGYFRDIRLIQPALKSLNDSYGEIGDYVANKVLPIYGKSVLKQIQNGFNLKGGRSDARRLEAIHKICGEEAWDLYVEAAEKGSKEVRLSAIKCLESAGDKSNKALPILIKQIKSKSREVRRAVYAALCKDKNEDAVDILINALKGEDIEIAASYIRINRTPRLLEYLIYESEQILSTLLDKKQNDSDKSKNISRFLNIILCFQTRDDKKTEKFLLSCFAEKDEINQIKSKDQTSYSGKDIVLRVADLLLQMGTPDTFEALIKDHESYDADLLTYAFIAAMRSKAPAYVYEHFSPYILEKSKLRQKMTLKGEKILSAAQQYFKFKKSSSRQFAGNDNLPEESAVADRNYYMVDWDLRWTDAAVKAQAVSLVCRLIGPGDQAAIDFLLDVYNKKGKEHLYEIMLGLIQAEYPEITKLMIESIKKTVNQSYSYERHYLISMFRYLPKESLPELEAFAKTLPEKIMEEMLKYIIR